MYTNYITDSCFVPKECLSLLLLSSSFFFFIVSFISPSPSLPLYSFLLSQRGNIRGGENGRGGEKIYATILTLCFLSHFLRLEEMTLHLSKKEMSLTLVPDRIRRHQNHQFFPSLSLLFLSCSCYL